MKEFKDLKFETHCNYPMFAKQAKMHFDNGYGVSVVTGKGAYSDESNPYEVAVLYKDELTYSTEITDDVIGYMTEDGVTEIMKKVQNLKSKVLAASKIKLD